MRLLLPYTCLWWNCYHHTRMSEEAPALTRPLYVPATFTRPGILLLSIFDYRLLIKNRCRKWSISHESFTYSHQNLFLSFVWLSFIACIVLSVCRVLFVCRRWVLQLADMWWLSRLTFAHSSDTVHWYSLYHPYLWKNMSRESKHGRSTCRRRRLVSFGWQHNRISVPHFRSSYATRMFIAINCFFRMDTIFLSFSLSSVLFVHLLVLVLPAWLA